MIKNEGVGSIKWVTARPGAWRSGRKAGRRVVVATVLIDGPETPTMSLRPESARKLAMELMMVADECEKAGKP